MKNISFDIDNNSNITIRHILFKEITHNIEKSTWKKFRDNIRRVIWRELTVGVMNGIENNSHFWITRTDKNIRLFIELQIKSQC